MLHLFLQGEGKELRVKPDYFLPFILKSVFGWNILELVSIWFILKLVSGWFSSFA